MLLARRGKSSDEESRCWVLRPRWRTRSFAPGTWLGGHWPNSRSGWRAWGIGN